jgi:hypothetical protein
MLFVVPATPSQFDQFWARYPKCPRRTDKPGSRKALTRALKFASFEEIMDGLKRYPFSPDPQYIPLPTTWLNQQRWDIEDNDFDPVLRAAGLMPDDFYLTGD